MFGHPLLLAVFDLGGNMRSIYVYSLHTIVVDLLKESLIGYSVERLTEVEDYHVCLDVSVK